jgi:vancomycin aglycone glucosyltransferase
MRALLSAVGTRGDVQPMIGLAVEVRRRGCEVRLCIPPNFIEWAQQLGFEALPVGIEMRQRPANAGSAPTAEQQRQLGGDLIANQFEAVGAAAEGCDVILGAGAHQYAARAVAEARGVRYVSAVYAPVSLRSPDHAPVAPPGQAWESGNADENLRRWDATAKTWNDRARERVNAGRASLGLAPVEDVLRSILGERSWLAADPMLGPAPATPGIEVLQTGAWLLPDPTPLAAELESFLAGGEPPIYLGFGSMPAAKDLSRTLIAAARAVGRRVILAQGWAQLALIDDAPDCLLVGEVNQQALFPRVAAAVHHGGAGTTTTAARAGVPQVIVPMFGDQPYWAGRVRALAIGTSTPSADLTAETLVEALRGALEPTVATRARTISPQIGTDGASFAAERLIARRSPGW